MESRTILYSGTYLGDSRQGMISAVVFIVRQL